MDLGLEGTRVVVTAGARGIGLAIARALAGEGARVHICDIDQGAIDAASAAFPGIEGSVCDVSDRWAVDEFFASAVDRLGGLDCLVNNAGIPGPTGRVDTIAPEDWDRTLAVNITGQYNCVRVAVPELSLSGNASIINLSSAAGRLGFALRTPYAAAKWAVIGFTKSLSIELAPLGIRVNAILPGIVEGDRQNRVILAKAAALDVSFEEMKERALERASIKEFITAEQLADNICFLVSPRARTTSGQAISICGDLQSLV
jgi:NAD(P)-dependent dehydrogenase (short-subunit alcohol dehydrogenase family)